MDSPAFNARFPESSEIGREVTDAHIEIYCDSGKEVGLWRIDRRTTQGKGEILGPEDADIARQWYAQKKEPSHADRVREREGRVLKALETAEDILQREGIRQLRGKAWQGEELVEIRNAIAAVKGGRKNR